MILTSNRDGLAAALGGLRSGGRRVVLVPTLGALHDGHRALLRAAREHGGATVVSVFVNPAQFAPGEDFERYPRTLEADLAMCRDEAASVVFAPPTDVMYPHGTAAVTVDPGPLGTELEGASRPGHFAGVLTVVAKLFGLFRPDVAVFGEKDYQQLTLIRRMVRDLELQVLVAAVPTVREPDGLALSSRNRYLTPNERLAAVALSAALRAGASVAPGGAQAVLRVASAVLSDESGLAVDYLELRAPDLGPAPAVGPARLLVAAKVGTTRLIDNTSLTIGGR